MRFSIRFLLLLVGWFCVGLVSLGILTTNTFWIGFLNSSLDSQFGAYMLGQCLREYSGLFFSVAVLIAVSLKYTRTISHH